MEKTSRGLPFWLYAGVIALVVYFVPLILLLADAGSGNWWFVENAPSSLQQAAEYVYAPIGWLVH